MCVCECVCKEKLFLRLGRVEYTERRTEKAVFFAYHVMTSSSSSSSSSSVELDLLSSI